jgi:hypothetical protein
LFRRSSTRYWLSIVMLMDLQPASPPHPRITEEVKVRVRVKWRVLNPDPCLRRPRWHAYFQIWCNVMYNNHANAEGSKAWIQLNHKVSYLKYVKQCIKSVGSSFPRPRAGLNESESLKH